MRRVGISLLGFRVLLTFCLRDLLHKNKKRKKTEEKKRKKKRKSKKVFLEKGKMNLFNYLTKTVLD